MVENLQCGVDSRKYYCQSSHRLRQERLSKQLSVNRLSLVQLKGNLEKKMALMKLEDIVQHEEAMAKEFCDDKFLIKKRLGSKILG